MLPSVAGVVVVDVLIVIVHTYIVVVVVAVVVVVVVAVVVVVVAAVVIVAGIISVYKQSFWFDGFQVAPSCRTCKNPIAPGGPGFPQGVL